MRRERRTFTPETKVEIIREHLLKKVPISNLCDKHGISPAQFNTWLTEFFANGAAAFSKSNDSEVRRAEAKISQLEEKIKKKDGVLIELLTEHVALKKTLGEN